MPFFRIGGTVVHMRMSGPKARQPKPCVARIVDPRAPAGPGRKASVYCLGVSGFACDWPVEGGTCDAPLCTDHAAEVAPGVHYCPIHMRHYREAGKEAGDAVDA